MTFDDRLAIQEGLTQGLTFKAIAENIGKDKCTVSKEIRKHITDTALPLRRHNQNGDSMEQTICPKLMKAPYVCNGCKQRRTRCAYPKRLYIAKTAQAEYESLLVDCREGIPLQKESFYEMDAIVSDGIKRGQHLYHISQTHDLGVSKSTVYRHLKRGYLSVSAVDFPRVVKFKPRQAKKAESIPKEAKTGRKYEDFRRFVEDNDISSWVEMDTVIGRIGGKVILTLDFTFCNFMAGILLENKTAAESAKKIRDLKASLAANNIRFGDIFPTLLTDNGGEFANVSAFERTLDGELESVLFFCDPMQSSQKPRVEKNHTLFRDIVPKGESFDVFTQETVNLIFSHVNNVKRKSLNGKSPFEVFAFTYGKDIAALLGIGEIPAQQVIQSPKLLKQ